MLSGGLGDSSLSLHPTPQLPRASEGHFSINFHLLSCEKGVTVLAPTPGLHASAILEVTV